jgi:inorganic pyrophosphatase
MKKTILRMPPFDRKEKCLNVIIETPKESRVKYAYNPESALFELKRALPLGMMFPYNFGFIPGTKAGDGDPLDILILNEEPLAPGCHVKAKLLGVIVAKQTDKNKTVRNDRLIGIAVEKETQTPFKSIELDERIRKEIESFFVSYNKLDGKRFVVIGHGGPGKARALVGKWSSKEEGK